MATITFPSNPVLNQIYSYDGNTWIWDGSSWQLLTNAALNAVVIGNVVPETGAFTDITANTVTANNVSSGLVTATTVAANTVSAGALQGTSLSLSGNILSAVRVQGPVTATGFNTVGAITTSAGITSLGNVSAPYFIGDGSLLTNLPSGGSSYSNANVASYLPTYTGDLQAGNVSVLGNILGNGISILGRVVASGNITGGNILTSGIVCTTGNVIGAYLFGDARYLTNVPGSNYSNANVAAYLPTYTGNLNATNYSGSGAGLSSLPGANVTGTVANAAYAAVAGTVLSIPAANIVGTVPAADTAGLAGAALAVPGSGVSGPVALANLATVAASANTAVSVPAANIVGAVANAVYATTAGAAATAGTVTTAAQPNITSVGTLTSLSVTGGVHTGNITSQNITVNGGAVATGNVAAQYFIGNGALLTGLQSATYSNANVAAYLPTYSGVVGAGSVTATGNIAATNIAATSQVSAGTVSATGNVRGGNIVSTGQVSVSGNITGAFLFGDARHLTNIPTNYSNANVASYLETYTGDINAGNLFVTGDTTVANLYVYGDEFSTQNIVAFGNVDAGNLRSSGRISSAGNITAPYYFGDGRFLANLPVTYSNSNVAAYLPTYSGSISGNVMTVGNIYTDTISTTNIFASGTISSFRSSVIGNIVSGNVITAGEVAAEGNVLAKFFFGDGRYIANLPTSNYSNANVASYLPTYAGNLSGNNLSVNSVTTAGNVLGENINAVTSVTAGTLTTSGNATVANLLSTGFVSAAGTVTGAQITTAGNVTGGNINTGGNVSSAGNIVANRFVIGDGRYLTNLPTTSNYSNANVAAYLPTYSGNLGGNVLSVTTVNTTDVFASIVSATGAVVGSAVTTVGTVTGGNIATAGTVSATGNVSGRYFFGDGRFLSNVAGNYSNANVAAYLPTYTGTVAAATVTVTGSVVGAQILGTTVSATGNVVASGNVLANTVVAGSIATGTILASGSIGTTGNIIGNYFIGNGRLLTGISTYSNANVASFLSTYTGDISADNMSLSGDVVGNNIYMYGKVFATTIVSAVGNVSGGNVTTPGNVSALGNIHSTYYFGDGRFLSNVAGNYSNANVAAYLPTYTGGLTAGTVSTTGNITAPYFFGNGSQLTGIQATVVGVLPSLSVTGNAAIGNISTAGNVNAAYFIGDGSQLTNLPSMNYSNANVASYLPTYAGNLTANVISASGNVTGNYILGNGRQLTGMYGNTNVAAYLPTYTGNITANNVSTAGNITAQYFVGNGSQLTGILATEIGVLASLSVTGNINTGNLNATGKIVTDGNIVTNGTLLSGNIVTSGTATIGSTLQAGNLSATGQIISSGNIVAGTGNYFVGNGRFITGVVASGVAANALVGTTLSSNVLYSSLQQLGTLNSLSVAGNTTLANANVTVLNATGNINSAANVTAQTLSALGNVSGDYILGNGSQLTGIQATVVGVLPSLSVTGNVNIGGYYIGDGGLLSNITVTTTYGNSNVAAYLPTYTGNLAGGNISVSGAVTGNGFTLRTLNAANVLGTVSNAVYAISAGSTNTANLAARVTANAQPNITSVGNLTSVTVTGNTQTAGLVVVGNSTSGNSTVTGNLSVLGNIFGNIQANFLVPGANTQVLYNLNGSAAANAAFTFDSANALLYVGGIVSATGNITGDYILGNGRFLTGLPEAYSNANVAAYLPTYTGDLSGANISASGNITAQYFTGNGSQLTGVVATNVGTLPSLSVTGNAVTGNVIANGIVSASGNISGNYLLGNAALLSNVPSVLTVSNWATGNVFSNTIANVRALRFNSETGITVEDLGNSEALISLGSSFKTWEVDGQANLVAVGEDVVKFVAGPGIVITTDPLAYPQEIAFAADVPNISNGTSNITIVNNGNIRAAVAGTQIVDIGTTGVSVNGNVTANYILANGAFLTGLPEAYSNANVAAYLPTYTGNLSSGNISATGNIVGNYIFGNGSQLGGMYSNTNVASYLPTYTGNITADAVSTTGNITAPYFIGNGSQLTGVVATNVGVLPSLSVTGNVNAGGATFNGNVGITGNLSVAGNINYVNVTDLVVGDPLIYFAANNTGNLLDIGWVGAYDDGVYQHTGLVRDHTDGVWKLFSNVVAEPTTVIDWANAQYDQFQSGQITSTATISAAGNITTGGIFVGNAAGLTNIVGANVTGTVANATNATYAGTATTALTATTAETVTANAQPSITSVGTLTGLSVSGDISTSGNVVANYFIGNGSLLTNINGANVTGTVANATYAESAGTVTANAQPNITSVGTLTSLSVSGNIDGGNVTGSNVTVTSLGHQQIAISNNGLLVGGIDLEWQFANARLWTTGIDSNGAITTSGLVSAGGNVTGQYIIGDGSLLTNINPGNISGLIGNSIDLGSNSQGQMVSNAVTLTTTTSVTNGLALLNQVLGKLVPPSPPNFPNSVTLSVASLSSYRMANFVQTDNTPGADKNVVGGTTVSSVRRSASYSTNTITNVGPGDAGTVSVRLNGVSAGNVTLTSNLNGNGTYSNLIITNNYDYHVANSQIAAGFWGVFTAQASGSVTQGWNEVYIADSATANTNTPYWYYDASTPGTPSVGNLTISATSTSNTYSSTVAHYNTGTQFTLGFTATALSGDMYPTSNTFVTGSAGGALTAPVSVTYSGAGVTTPLARNLYVSSGAQSVTTTSNVVSGFGASTTGPSVSVVNSYATGTGTFTSALGANVLYKTGTASTMEESNVVIGGTIGSGSGAAFRIVNPGSTDTPAYTGSEAAFNSQSGPLQTYDATIVAAVLKHDQTNYSTGYLPVGPDLSSGRSGAQYFTFKIMRSSVSKFDVKWTGTIAGLWVALPGSLTDSTSTLNGWLDMSVAYGGAGAPGANIAGGGNGSNGCALGTVAPLNSAQTNRSITATFGTVSSTSATNNEIYIRIKLTSGQSVTALSLQPASN